METGRHKLFKRGCGKQVSGKLFDRELIKRQILVQGMNDPVSVLPDGAWLIAGEAIGIGITGRVEPVTSPAFSIMRGSQQAVDQSLERIG